MWADAVKTPYERRFGEHFLRFLCSQDWMNNCGPMQMECYCNLRNIEDSLADVKTPYERKFGEHFTGPIVPHGAAGKN